jgi:hypothetical protein
MGGIAPAPHTAGEAQRVLIELIAHFEVDAKSRNRNIPARAADFASLGGAICILANNDKTS